MELSKNILNGISIAANSAIISDNLCDFMINDVLEIACGKLPLKESEKQFLEHEHKNAHSSLLSFVLEAAKHDAETTGISTILEDCGMDPERIAIFLRKFQEKKESIQIQLSLVGKNHDHIIDVNWRQDYVIKSSNCEKICEPSYIITLKTWNSQSNSKNDVTFSCSLEQLQDLVLKLKDATKCIERNAA